jgi:SulP family sulfate permease
MAPIAGGLPSSWGSLRVLGKVPRQDALVIIAVAAMTVLADLATAVLCGIVITALAFTWEHARHIRLERGGSSDGECCYAPHGTLFFASTARFAELFDPAADPQRVVLDCRHLRVADHSAVAVLDALRQRYQRAGKELRLRHLSQRCAELLQRAGGTGGLAA